MASNMKNKYEYLDETSIDRELICTICYRPFDDPRCLSCGHTFCHECITQRIDEDHASCPTCQQTASMNDFSEVDDLMHKKLDDLLVKCLECQQITLSRRNIHDHINKTCSTIDIHSSSSDTTCLKKEEQDQMHQSSAILLFEPLRSILSELIIQNRKGKEQINQLEKQTKQQYQTLTGQLNDQSKKNEELQLEVVQLKEQIIEHKTHINKLEADDRSQKTTIIQIDQRLNVLETNVKSLTNKMQHTSGECVMIFSS